MENLDVSENFGPFWAYLDTFGPFQTKINLFGNGAFEQKIIFRLKWSKWARTGPNGQKHLG